mmetsp:Transcript_18202/g.34538  ORF Transcript_18202/g.34538 Transcript_18202/m.34538 type:complete len:280 (+) Transcript_18202:42-881(+)|eukprot:scaffold4079_cov167-Amphora_coffeaeformis.AAC.15
MRFHQPVAAVVLSILLGFWIKADFVVEATENTDTCEGDGQCLNGGTCQTLETGSKQCQCQEGYSGLFCGKFCPLQCSNGGRCYEKNEETSYSGSSVTKADHYQSIADTSPQLEKSGRNSGTDIYYNDYACHCKGLFTGYLCDIPYTNCGDMTRCFYGGECQPNSEIEPCKCAAGYSGRYCELYGAWDDDDGAAGLVEFPKLPQIDNASFSQEPSRNKPWPLILGSIGLGCVLGLGAFALIQRKQRRRFNSTWLAASHASSSSSVAGSFEAQSRTFVNII